MYTRTILHMEKIKTVDDLRSLFSVDASFVNLDNQFYEIYGEQDDIVPFDAIIQRTDWQGELDNTVHQLGLELLDFDSDFTFFDYKIIETNSEPIVSVAFTLIEN